MPVRKIPKNYLLVTGDFSSKKNGRSLGYESLLERDLMILLEFDDTVKGFEEQPARIPFKVDGKPKKSYVPDILVHYHPAKSGAQPRSVLGEVKDSADLKKNKAKYAPKFNAAAQYAEERGWEWRKFTEKDIRTPFLENLKFLREYHESKPDAALQQEVISALENSRGSLTVDTLLQKLCPTDERTLLVAPAIWYLIAAKKISTNLKKPLDMNSKLSLSGGTHD